MNGAAATETSAQDSRPIPLPVVAENIPEELKRLNHWVPWKFELRDGRWTKPPFQVDGQHYAKANDPRTWGSFEDALSTYEWQPMDGIGFEPTPELGLVFIDLDHCVDLGTQKLAPRVIEIIERFHTYTERSPIDGVRIIARGSLPCDGKKKGGIEVYSAKHYLTLTGQKFERKPTTIEPCQDAIDWLLETHFKEPEKPKSKPNSGNGAWHPSDDELLDKAFAAKNGDKLKALYHGDVGSYPSQSEADLALCSMLAFWAADEAQLDGLFRRSGLMRDKWDQKHGAVTYGEITIGKAFATRTELYEPNGFQGQVGFPPFSRTDNEQSKKPELKPEALYGLAGEIVRAIGPYTEAHDVALLLNSLAAFGNITGSSAHATVQTTEHPGRLFVAQVGPTSKGRKDTGWSPIKYLFSLVDPEWSKNRIKTGLSSGEGLVFNVRDPIYKQEPIKEKGRVIDYQEVMVDQGETDKRLLVVEPEFASTLTMMGREGNTLSAVIRQAWDDGNLSPLTKNNPIRSTGAHITLITFITSQELLCRLDDTSKGNGFANRFLWALVERSKELPEGAMIPQQSITPLVERLTRAINFARKGGIVKRNKEARDDWATVYGPLSAGRPGLTGAMLSRAEAQVLRLSVLYALLDCSTIITVDHLKGALAVWEYCEASTKAIFGNRLGDHTADRILDALRAAGAAGLTDNEIYELFGRKRPAAERDRALSLLRDIGLATCQINTTGGRPSTRWFVTEKGAT